MLVIYAEDVMLAILQLQKLMQASHANRQGKGSMLHYSDCLGGGVIMA